MTITLPARRRLLAAILSASLGVPLAAAQSLPAGAGGSPLALQLTLQRVVVDAQGRERVEDISDVRPGDLLEYRGVYTNRSPRALADVSATLPVPVHTQYVPASARPAGVLAARADARYAPVPLMRPVRAADGQTTLQPLPPAEYRSLRWPLGTLAPGQSVTVLARMRVDADSPSDAAVAAAQAGASSPSAR